MIVIVEVIPTCQAYRQVNDATTPTDTAILPRLRTIIAITFCHSVIFVCSFVYLLMCEFMKAPGTEAPQGAF